VVSAVLYASLHLIPDNHANIPPLSFYRPDALPAAQPTASKHWRQYFFLKYDIQICTKSLVLADDWVYSRRGLPQNFWSVLSKSHRWPCMEQVGVQTHQTSPPVAGECCDGDVDQSMLSNDVNNSDSVICQFLMPPMKVDKGLGRVFFPHSPVVTNVRTLQLVPDTNNGTRSDS